MLLGSFTGASSDIYRAVHFFRDNDFFFAEYAKEFFCRTHELLREGRIREVRRLLVYSSEEEIHSDSSQRIIKFHAQKSGYVYRLIAFGVYSEFQRHHNLHPAIDFGIFGDKRVYRARTDRPDFVIGTWSGRTDEVRKYVQFFDACWDSLAAREEPDLDSTASASIDWLFAPDNLSQGAS